MKPPLAKSLPDILTLPQGHQQDLAIAAWIAGRLPQLNAVYHAFGTQGERNELYDDLLLRVEAHLLTRHSDGLTRFAHALQVCSESQLDARANAVLARSFYQEWSKHLRLYFPAFSKCRGQIRYAVIRYGQRAGLRLTGRSRYSPEAIVRQSFHARLHARLPNEDDLLPIVPKQLLFARGWHKIPLLAATLDSLAVRQDLQLQLPVNVLSKILAQYSGQPHRQSETDDVMVAPDLSLESQEAVELARKAVAEWLKQRYFHKVMADQMTQQVMLAVLDEYARRLDECRQRMPSKDVVLQHMSNMSAKEYEHSKLRTHIHYMCARFRKILAEFQ